ncbi:MAG TPA: hypothetical protein VHJ77_18160 [Vicinamibacterales bacterium]|jgi:hypothetical protein|nr:hypothetical protein [Vicinamibacterales bacterium]
MTGSLGPRHRSLARATALAATLYAIILAVGPVLHHDLACHLKSRTHCTVCVVSVTASGTQGSAGLIAADLQAFDALALDRNHLVTPVTVALVVGRSPPA